MKELVVKVPISTPVKVVPHHNSLTKKIEIDSIHSHRFSVMNIPFDETGSRVDVGLWKVVG